MGIDWFDIMWTLEKRFGVEVTGDDILRVLDGSRSDFTAGELHEVVCAKLRAAGMPVPHSSWTRVKWTLASCLSIKASDISRESLVMRDLGMS